MCPSDKVAGRGKASNASEGSALSEEEYSENERTVVAVESERDPKSAITTENIMRMKVHELREKLKEINVDSTGRKSELQERLKYHIRQEEESGSEEPDESEDDEYDYESRKTARKSPIANASPFTIKDVEDSMAYFTGDDNASIKKWIADFEDLSMLLQWNELQKLIYAKRMLKGSAKQFIAAERGILSWKDLQQRLKNEFASETNSATVHSRLFRRRKLPHETSRQYLYAMREIASEGNVENEALIEYIINGIQDNEYNKSILYQSRTLAEIKKNLKLYDKMREKSERKTSVKKEETKEKKDTSRKAKIPRCNTCGSPEHDARTCPEKGKGPKCFKCNNFGHIANKCDSAKSERDNKTAGVNCVSKSVYPIKVNNVECRALIDSGSDISLMKKNQHEEIGSPPLTTTAMSITGAGNATTRVIGFFNTAAQIADDIYGIKFFIVPSQSIPYNVILGQDFLENVELRLDKGNIVAIRKAPTTVSDERHVPNSDSKDIAEAGEENTTNTTDAAFRELREIMCVEVGELNVKEQYKDKIKMLVDEYKPAEKVNIKIETVITLKDNTPINIRPRRLAPKEKTVLDNQIDEWLREGVIQPSTSEYASPIVIVPKKNGSYRVCIDYRELNKKIERDHFPMPLIEEKIDELRNARVFSVIDLKNSYLHVPIAKESVKYTAFVTPDAQYEFLKTPFGLCISATSFLRYIDEIFRDLIQQKVIFTYVDDIIIPGSDDEDALEKLTRVLRIAAANGLTISWNKCQFLRTRIEYLGHEIENGNVYPGNAKIKAVQKFPQPKNRKQLQSLLGLTGYFRKFIKDYAKIAIPLSDLLKQNRPFIWKQEQQAAFLTLKSILSTNPVLRIYNPKAETEIHTDASQEGFGAVLLQKAEKENAFHPVYYYSKKTTDAEQKYHSYELEVLAVINAVKKFRVYVLGIPFKLVTDCEAFKKTLSKKDLCPKVARWALSLEEFEYNVEHRKGARVKHVDALSRFPVLVIEDTMLAMLKKKQGEEERLRLIKHTLETEKYDDYFVENGILMKQKNSKKLVVVPSCMYLEIIRNTHENGHIGVRKMKERIETEYYIPNLEEKLKKFISCCIQCVVSERKLGKREGELTPIPKGSRPLETYHIDHVGPMTATGKAYRYIFVVIDGFSKFTWLYPTKTTNAKEVINKLDSQQKIFGNPDRIISDRGAAFTSLDFQNYCEEENIKTIKITTGIPRGNGQAERTIRTIIPILTKLSLNNPEQWYKHIGRVQKCMNSTFHRSIGMSPFEVLFGISMKNKQDHDIIKLIEQEAIQLYDEDRDKLRMLAKESIMKIQEENKRHYDKQSKPARQYKEGDWVFIKRTQFGPALKIKQKYLGPYSVTKVKRNNRYEVARVGDSEGPMMTSTAADFMKAYQFNE